VNRRELLRVGGLGACGLSCPVCSAQPLNHRLGWAMVISKGAPIGGILRS